MTKCVWNCGRDTSSAEDVFPNWLRKYLDVRAQRPGRYFEIRHFVRDPLIPESLEIAHVETEKSLFIKAYETVCGQCNSEWMSRIQENAKPILIPIIEGERQPLGVHTRQVIATWATMTAIMVEYAGDQIVGEARRLAFRDTKLPPPNTWVLLSTVEAEETTAVDMLREQTIDEKRPVLYSLVFTIKSLGVHVLQGNATRDQQHRMDGARGVSLTPIWWRSRPVASLATSNWAEATLSLAQAFAVNTRILLG